MAPARLYESPFTDYGNGPEAVFDDAAVDRIIDVLREVESSAKA